MGSQPSKQDTAVEACLADFPGQEREHVLSLFETLCKGPGNERSPSHDEHSIDPQQFNAYFGPLLPPTLLTCFRVTMQMHSMIHQPNDDLTSASAAAGGGGGSSENINHHNSNSSANKNKRRSVMTRSTSVDASSRISKYGWVMTIHRLSKTSIEEQAGLSFMLQTHDASLESFVGNVTRAAMVFWLAGEVGSWKEIPEKDVEATAEFLLTRHLEAGRDYDDDLEEEEEDQDKDKDEDAKAQQRKGRETRTGPKSKAARDWLEAAQKRDALGQPSSRELSRSAFLNWYQRTVEYQIMFTILIKNLFLGSSTLPSITTTAATAGAAGAELSSSDTPTKRIKLPMELENKLCQRNFIAPRIKGGLDVAPRFSRLLSVADFFQLRYALPTPVIGNMSSPKPPSSSSTHGSKQGTAGAGVGAGSSSGDGLNLNDSVRPTPPLRLLFSSRTSGASFSTLLQKITYQGPTLVVMKDEDGYIFGAYADQDWEQGPKFYGTDRSFLFTIRPQFRIYRPSKLNSNYQYLDSGTKTLPNGMGFGGQLRYFGLWLASDFQTGQSAAEPLCSTFQSPRLSKQQNFRLDEMEVWQVHPSVIERDEEPKHSAMDAHPDAVALLEMANRKMYSKDVRAPENVYESD